MGAWIQRFTIMYRSRPLFEQWIAGVGSDRSTNYASAQDDGILIIFKVNDHKFLTDG